MSKKKNVPLSHGHKRLMAKVLSPQGRLVLGPQVGK